jgi:site-specific recombinase XerD
MKNNKITLLMNRFMTELRQNGYALDQVEKRAGRLHRLLLEYSEKKGVNSYTPEIGQALLSEKYPDYTDCLSVSTPPEMKELRRTIKHLDNYLITGKIIPKKFSGNEGLCENAVKLITQYTTHLHLDYAAATVRARQHGARQFLRYLSVNDVAVSKISETDIVGFINSKPELSRTTVGAVITELKHFLKFLNEAKIVPTDLSRLVPQIRIPKLARIPSVWKKEDVEKLLSAVDRGSPVGKRDYAILLTVAKTGIRAGDVFALKKENINWTDCRIELIQNKTKQPVSLPLQNDVGWAIIDYLKNGRPDCDSPLVFVSHSNNSMCEPLKSEYGYTLMEKYIRQAGIRMTQQQKHGLHSLRHTLAARLMEAKTPPAVIAEILGQISPDTIEMYLKTDIEQLRQCALNPEEVFGNAVGS